MTPTNLSTTDVDLAEAAQTETEARTQTVLNMLLDGIITTGENGVIETANPAAGQIFGYEPSEMIGQNLAFLMPDSDTSEHDRCRSAYTGKSLSGSPCKVAGRHFQGVR